MADGLNNFFNSLGGQLGSAIGNPTAQQRPGIPLSGPVRTPFLVPNDLLSSVYKYEKGVERTVGVTPKKGEFVPSPAVTLNEDRSKSVNGQPYTRTRTQAAGFTPISYYKALDPKYPNGGEIFLHIPQNLKTTAEKLSENKKSYDDYGDNIQSDFKFSLDDFNSFVGKKNELETWDGGNGGNSWVSGVDQMPAKLSNYSGTPYDNEDPVYFGFEIIINTQTSPLFNGELEKFIDQFGGDYTEIESRRLIINQFKNEILRYFRFDTGLTLTERYDSTKNILATDAYGQNFPSKPKRYYIKKISGLSKLIEANASESKKSFVDYGKDKLIITFYEDTTLNLGTVASLYKLIYWSRLRGKSIIPENLLRFDCEIIISELRDFVSLRKSGNMLEFLKSNLTRYRYQLFECQLWFDKMTHPDSIDLTETLKSTDTYDVDMDFKYSNMIFERYNPSSSSYVRLRNGTIDPLANFGGSASTSREYISRTSSDNDVYNNVLGTWSGLSTAGVQALENFLVSGFPRALNSATIQDTSFNNLKQGEKNNIYKLINAPLPVPKTFPNKNDIFGKAADQLIQNLKKAALNDAQRGLNAQFALLNNSLDKIRNSFGIGKMSAPTNVYNIPPGGQFFFDVQNSLRNFAGDVLTGFITGG